MNRIKNQEAPVPGNGKVVDINQAETQSDAPPTERSNSISRAQSINVEQLRVKYDQAVEMREAVQEKLTEEYVKLEERSKGNAIALTDIENLTNALNQERQITRKLEQDVARDKNVVKALDEKLAVENNRRDELVKILQAELQFFREFKAKIQSVLAMEKEQMHNFTLNLTELDRALGTPAATNYTESTGPNYSYNTFETLNQ